MIFILMARLAEIGKVLGKIIWMSVFTQVRSFFCSGLNQIRSRLEQFLNETWSSLD